MLYYNFVRKKQTREQKNDIMSKGHRNQHERASIRLSRNNLNNQTKFWLINQRIK